MLACLSIRVIFCPWKREQYGIKWSVPMKVLHRTVVSDLNILENVSLMYPAYFFIKQNRKNRKTIIYFIKI